MMLLPGTVKHLTFAWDLFSKFCDRLKIAKFNTSEFDFFFLNKLLSFFLKQKTAFTCTSITMYTSDSQH